MSAGEIQYRGNVSNVEHCTKQESNPKEPPEKIISIMNEYAQHSPQMGYPVSSDSDENVCDTIRTDIFQKNGNSVFILLTLPVTTTITSIYGEIDETPDVVPQERIANAYGVTEGFNFDQNTLFEPGDYCMGVVFSSEEEAHSIEAIRLELRHEKISNLMISHMIFGLCRELGFDPSHVMKYPVKSVVRAVPFYKKTNSDIAKLKKELPEIISENMLLMKSAFSESMDSKLQEHLSELRSGQDQTTSEIYQKLEDLKTQIAEVTSREKHVVSTPSYEQEKGMMSQNTVSLEDYLKIKKERDLYYERLQETEDYIEDHILSQHDAFEEESFYKKSDSRYYPNAHLSKGTRSVLGRRK